MNHAPVVLGLFWVTMLTFGITTTLHGLAPLATYGLGSIFFLLLASVGFLLPAGLVAAELATAWPREGGVYVWVGEAFGQSWGFLATWLQWLQNVIFWTVILTGSAAMLAYGFGWREGAENPFFAVAVVLGTIWMCSWVTARGLRCTGWVGSIGSLGGTIFPGIILIGAAAFYVWRGNPPQTPLDATSLLPDLTKPGNLTFAISTIMIFAGVELMGTRVAEMREPGQTFPRATFLAMGLTVLLLIPAVLSIAVLVPRDDLSLTAGLVQAVEVVASDQPYLVWLPLLFALALFLDAAGEIAGWMAGTPIAMAAAGRDGFLPAALGRRQGDSAPGMLWAQAGIGSLVSIVFLLVPSVQGAFWVLSALLVQLYVLMYLLLFAAAWTLRQREPEHPRPYRVPGGRTGLAVVCGVGGTLSLAVLLVGFVRPTSLDEMSKLHYLLVVGGAFVICLLPPIGLIIRRKH